MTEKIEELKKDIAELQFFENQSIRTKVKDILSIEARKLTAELIKLQDQYINQPNSKPSPVKAANKHYVVKLNNYAWDQTEKFVKFYVTLPKVHSIPGENVTCNFGEKSVELNVNNLENKDYNFTINKLLYEIDIEKSNWKIKTDMVIINCAKKENIEWSHVTELEKKAKDTKFDMETEKNADPSEGLMSLMKNMYEKGDDEMKRTIAKAWTESQSKGPQF